MKSELFAAALAFGSAIAMLILSKQVDRVQDRKQEFRLGNLESRSGISPYIIQMNILVKQNLEGINKVIKLSNDNKKDTEKLTFSHGLDLSLYPTSESYSNVINYSVAIYALWIALMIGIDAANLNIKRYNHMYFSIADKINESRYDDNVSSKMIKEDLDLLADLASKIRKSNADLSNQSILIQRMQDKIEERDNEINRFRFWFFSARYFVKLVNKESKL